MRPSLVSSSLILFTSFTAPSTALQALTNSPCALQCGNTLGSTSGADIVCHDSDYGSAAGIVYKNCITCQLGSTYVDPVTKQTDLQWAMFNIRYALSWCLFGYPDNPNVENTPCTTSFACGPIESGFEFDSLSPNASIYKFCALVPDINVPKCKGCLALQTNEFYLSNFLTYLNAGCLQQPTPGNVVSIEGSLFSSTVANITEPSATPLPYKGPAGGLTLGAKVGIAIGAILVFLLTTGCCIICRGRRRRRKALARHQEQTGYANFMAERQAGNPNVPPSMSGTGFRPGDVSAGGFHDSPQSQRPLFQNQGWGVPQSAIEEGSPASAMGEKVYFSPYSSHYSSPVSAQDQVSPSNQWQWPMQGDRKGSVGGSSSALGRSRSIEKRPIDDGDRIEMHNVTPMHGIAPVLLHPGNGRGGGLTEADARRGQAL